MNQPSKNKPRKFGEHPHRAFQCLETIYVPENIADKIKVGDRVYWDFDSEQLRVNDKVIWKIPVSRGRYYGCIDSHRHKVVSWVAAKEGNKLKLFTSIELKHPYGETLNPTESESIEIGRAHV